MNESYLKGILAEICEEEIAELNKFPPFKPSLRHRLAMKRIFALYEKKNAYYSKQFSHNLNFAKQAFAFK